MTEERIQTLLLKLQKLNTDERYKNYLERYIYKRSNTIVNRNDCCNPIYGCSESGLKSKENIGLGSSHSDNSTGTFGGFKGGFISNKKEIHVTPTEISSQKRCREQINSDLSSKQRDSLNFTILFGLRCFYLTKSKIQDVIDKRKTCFHFLQCQLEHLFFEREYHDRYTSYIRRSLVSLTDVIYISEPEFRNTFVLYLKIAEQMSMEENIDAHIHIIGEIFKNYKMAALSIFIGKQLRLLDNHSKLNDSMKSDKKIIILEGYQHFLDQLHDHDYHFQELTNLLHRYGSFLSLNSSPENVFRCEERELISILEAMTVYKDAFQKDTSLFLGIFKIHPIFGQLTSVFFMMKEGYGMSGTINKSTALELKERLALYCGLVIPVDCLPTERFETSKSRCLSSMTVKTNEIKPSTTKEKTGFTNKRNTYSRTGFALSAEGMMILKNGVEFYRRLVANAYKEFSQSVIVEVRHLLINKSIHQTSIPTNRPPLFTDIIYMTESNLKCSLTLYQKTAIKLGKDPPIDIMNKKFNTRLLTIVGLYMGHHAHLFHNACSMDKYQHVYKRMTIIQGYKCFLEQLKKHKWSFAELYNFLFEYAGHFMATLESTKDELIHIFRAMERYRTMFEKDGADRDKFYNCFNCHPIFTQMTTCFYLIKQGFVRIGTKHEELAFQMLHDRITSCGILVSKSLVTETIGGLKSSYKASKSEGNEPKTPVHRDDSLVELVASLTDDEKDSLTDVICVGLEFCKQHTKCNDSVIFPLVEHLLKNPESNLPILPKERSPVVADVIYISNSLFKSTMRRYKKVANHFDGHKANVSVKKILTNRELTIISIYVGNQAKNMIHTSEMSAPIYMFRRMNTIQGYSYFLEVLEEFNGDYSKLAVYFVEYGTFMGDITEQYINSCNDTELLHILKAFGKYKHMFLRNQEEFERGFSDHPLFAQISWTFFMIKSGTDSALPTLRSL